MKHVIFVCALVSSAFAGQCYDPSPDQLAMRLEQVPGTTDVIVVLSWEACVMQGFSYGVCHNPDEVTVGPCEVEWGWLDPCSKNSTCEAVACPDDLAVSRHGWAPPEFNSVTIQEDGVTQGTIFCMKKMDCPLPPTDRFEALRVKYTLREEIATLEFCSGILGSPPVPNVMVFGGASLVPATQEGLTLDLRQSYRRGDANVDGRIDLSDAVFLLRRLFREDDGPLPCTAAGDANDDKRVDIADAIKLLSHLFGGVGPLSEPFLRCGYDPTTPLTCLTYHQCP